MDVLYLFVRAAIGYSLAFVKVKTLEKDLRQMLQGRKRCVDTEAKERDEDDPQQAVGVAELKERIKRAVETHKSCTTSMSATYARLVLHCSNYENHKEDERFFECVYFFVCSVVKLGVVADYWRPIEEELGFLFRGAQFSANIKLHATTAYQASTSNSEPQDTSTSSSHSGARSLLAGTGTGGGTPVFEIPKSRISHFAPSVPVRRIVAELQATKNRAARNMELSQALRDRIRTQRSEDRRRLLEAAISPRQSIVADTLDAQPSHLQKDHIYHAFTGAEPSSSNNRGTREACAQVRVLWFRVGSDWTLVLTSMFLS
ncbi:uncharacterized protein PITG_00621 [Phytophthora infestans T30-4]|uniref:Uncharacterized protein n=1 Tax=Phytophthora infestans (strain T30-4) TaxID=403677 RepID=D0MR95_PHYIT|nr:uncharacterized protein PITG_00621 [Phytophthora infestans T30-4]EEY58014.1 conserved hypothetical protein [Phytophthora infestans T30-4]|eukprot:XP_002909200.1 conserved hypothetical protein [Phytophthora infestans T30-4]